MTNLKCDPGAQILLLLAEGFAETEVTLYISEMREAGLRLSLVGLTKRPIRSEHGVEIIPDRSIDDVIRSASPVKLVILPGGQGAVNVWGADPRTRLLLALLPAQAGGLVTTGASISILESIVGSEFSLRPYDEFPAAQPPISSEIPVLVAPATHDALLKEFVSRLVQACTQ